MLCRVINNTLSTVPETENLFVVYIARLCLSSRACLIVVGGSYQQEPVGGWKTRAIECVGHCRARAVPCAGTHLLQRQVRRGKGGERVGSGREGEERWGGEERGGVGR